MNDLRSTTNTSSPSKFYINVDYDEATGSISDFCTDRGFPLGGFGTGGFNFMTDGGFGHFRTNHNWFQIVKGTIYPKGTFFAARAQTVAGITSRILRRHYHGGAEFLNIEPIAHAKFTGKLPHFHLAFDDDNFPITIMVSGFTPIIPRDPKDSTLPAAFFTATATNPSDGSVDVSIMLAFENILGLGGSGSSHLLLRDGPVTYDRSRGNYAEDFSCEAAAACGSRLQEMPRRMTRAGEWSGNT